MLPYIAYSRSAQTNLWYVSNTACFRLEVDALQKSMRELSSVIEMFYSLIDMIITRVYTFVITQVCTFVVKPHI